MNKPSRKIRQMSGTSIEDPSLLENLMYNEPAGGQKNLTVGPSLSPMLVSGAYTTNATAIKSLKKGTNLAIYNNSGTLHSITAGDSTVTSLAPGVTSASGFVGVPCLPNSWTYLSTGYNTHIVASNAALLVFIIQDDSYITNT